MTAHGTYAGWSRHQRQGDPPCADCRKAQAAYMRERRRRNPDIYSREKADTNARSRALWRLARLYPAAYAVLVAEEKAKGASSRPVHAVRRAG